MGLRVQAQELVNVERGRLIVFSAVHRDRGDLAGRRTTFVPGFRDAPWTETRGAID